ncbi:MAG: PEP/pyruvate-binding domain-containing protein [Sideroxydans sp.]|nr:PEP/pyruvate-binding domain-containing protein [Sideroxydans sp.]
MNRPFVPLVDAQDAEIFGAKAATLARMLAAGFAVPTGFAIPAHGLRAHLQRATTPEKIGDTSLAAALQNALREIACGDAVYAVRSSAIGEDSADHSFAGQLDSLLNVRGEQQLAAAVAAVWSSLWTARCLHYQQLRGVKLDSMGVIVQRQVDARHAGVMFTRAPSDMHGGQPALIIEYCNGLGEGLVAGEVDPGRILLDLPRGDVVSHEAGEDTASRLDERDITALFEQATLLEQHFGQPLDIEWAIDISGKLWLLQARPITATASTSRRATWTNANIAENFPEPVSPFLYSIVRRGYAAYFRNLGLGFGMSRRRIAAMDDALEHIVGVHGGRLYYNLSNIHTLISLAPSGRWLTRAFNDFVGAAQFPPPQNLPAQSRLEQGVELLRVAALTTWRYLNVQRGLLRFETTVDTFCARTRQSDLAAMTSAELRECLRGFLEIRLRKWNDAALADTAAMVCYGLLQRQLRRWLPGTDNSNLHNDLLVGLPGLASHAPVEKLWLLSRQIRADQALAQLFAAHDSATIAQQLEEQARFAAFRQALQDYLEHWGFRSSGELMLTRPSPEEDPGQTLALLRSYAALEAPSPQQQLAEQAALREAATREVCDRLPFLRARLFTRLLAATQGAIRLRERARQKQAKLYVRLRHIVLSIGQQLVAAGTLQHADDAMYLEYEELDALLAGHAMYPYDIGAQIRQRREAQTQLAAMTPPDNFELAQGEYLPPHTTLSAAPDAANDSQRLHGTGACGGRIVANAVVLADASEADRMRQGDIVVTRQTDPGWACVFFLAKGLVVERGGMLSHGAIIARELGIPAVVGVRDATRRIASGSRVAIDGGRGVVDILS